MNNRAKTAIAAGATALVIGSGTFAMWGSFDEFKLSAIQLVGSIAGVNRNPDPYLGFYVVGQEVASPSNIHPRQWKQLQQSHHGQQLHILTAIQENPQKKKYRLRRFIVTDEQARNIQRGNRVDLSCLGQYLAPNYAIYPIAQQVTPAAAEPEQFQRIEQAIRNNEVDGSYVANLYKNINPKP